jgi:hypothetical protein
MSAFKNLVEFNKQLPHHQGVELLNLIHAYVLETEAEKLALMEQYESIFLNTKLSTNKTLSTNPHQTVQGC